MVSRKLRKQTITFVAHMVSNHDDVEKKNRVFLLYKQNTFTTSTNVNKKKHKLPWVKGLFKKKNGSLKKMDPQDLPPRREVTAQLPHLVFARTALCQPLGNGGNELRGQTSKGKILPEKKKLVDLGMGFLFKVEDIPPPPKKIGLHGFESGWVCRNRYPNWLKNVVT